VARLHDLVRFARVKPPQLPNWLERIVSAGIVTSDPKIARRQRFVNMASYFGSLNTAARFVQNFSFEYADFIFVQSIVGFYLVWGLSINRLHRFGENVAAIALAAWFLSGLSCVVLLFGLQSGVQIYFATIGIFLLLYGIEHWRLYVITLAVTFVFAFVMLSYGPEVGSALPADSPLVHRLVVQATVITILVNTFVLAYALLVLQRAEIDLERQSKRAEALVSVVLPGAVARRLRAEPDRRIADRLDGVTILFADLADFTEAAHREQPETVVAYLDDFVRAFDEVCERYGVEKIKTIGDAYMAASGLQGDGREGAVAMGNLALDVMKLHAARPPLGDSHLSLRIGIHCGSAIAGVIGDMRISYDLWGDAVNMASRLESQGEPGRIQVSEAFRRMVGDAFTFEERAPAEYKGIGVLRAYFLLAKRDAH
jgi:adenylate cyclase